MKTLSHAEQNRVLGGPIALLKAHASAVFESVDHATANVRH
jgi:hypothetical protein